MLSRDFFPTASAGLPCISHQCVTFLAGIMAKVGEGDDRWIVKERDDGKNVNNWHWSETNLTEWSKERLGELLVGVFALEESSGKGWCKTTKLEKCTGDVTVQSRKQKKFPLYELEIKLKWEGQLWDADVCAATPPRAPRPRTHAPLTASSMSVPLVRARWCAKALAM